MWCGSHGESGCPCVSAAAKIACNYTYIYLFTGSQTYLKSSMFKLIHKNCNIDTFCEFQLAYDSIQMFRFYLVEIHLFFCNVRYNTSSVHKKKAFQQCTPQNLVLCIGLFIKSLCNYFCKIDPFFHQCCCCAHGRRMGTGITEHTGIMHHSCVKALGSLHRHLPIIQQIVDQLTCRACIWHDIVLVCKTLVAHMMIYTESYCRFFEKDCRKSKSSHIPAIQCDKQIIGFFFRHFMPDLICIFHELQCIRKLFQINIDLFFRKILSDIVIQSHAGTSTVPIRADMSAKCDRPGF